MKRPGELRSELGYTTLLEVEGLNNPVDPLRVGRLNVTSIPPSVLFARMEIVAPVKSRAETIFAQFSRQSSSFVLSISMFPNVIGIRAIETAHCILMSKTGQLPRAFCRQGACLRGPRETPTVGVRCSCRRSFRMGIST